MERSSSSSNYRRHHHSSRDSNNIRNPSFSSILLDSIYRSIDDSSSSTSAVDRRRNTAVYREKTTTAATASRKSSDNISVQKQSGAIRGRQNGAFRRKSAAEYSSSSSSESSYGIGTGFYSSESADDSLTRSNLKPIRTSAASASAQTRCNSYRSDDGDGRGFVKKKSRSLKNIYGDLKKSKQQHHPISPGGRLASFLNSLFTAGAAKKAKIAGRDEIRPSNSSNCSSASSFSRSCLSKTPSSRAASSGKRSVRFYLVDEESRPCGQKNLEEVMAAAAAAENEELKIRVMKESRRVEAAARELLKNYCQRKNATTTTTVDDMEEEDDDVASCASSDLFELDNLSAIEGIERYREELPVYETTHLSGNRAAYYC
ncbi:Protein BIG GRAIN 1-like A [Linum perenne]